MTIDPEFVKKFITISNSGHKRLDIVGILKTPEGQAHFKQLIESINRWVEKEKQ